MSTAELADCEVAMRDSPPIKMHAYPQVNMLDSFTGRKKTFVIPFGDTQLPKEVVIANFMSSNQLPGANRGGETS